MCKSSSSIRKEQRAEKCERKPSPRKKNCKKKRYQPKILQVCLRALAFLLLRSLVQEMRRQVLDRSNLDCKDIWLALRMIRCGDYAIVRLLFARSYKKEVTEGSLRWQIASDLVLSR